MVWHVHMAIGNLATLKGRLGIAVCVTRREVETNQPIPQCL